MTPHKTHLQLGGDSIEMDVCLSKRILFERQVIRRRQRLETHEIVSQKSLLIPVSQKLIIQTSCER
jgi:hypothetical protein